MPANKIHRMCDWFNSLEQNSQINALDFLNNKNNELILSDDDKADFFDFIQSVVGLIVESNDDKESVNKTLTSFGLDKIVIGTLCSFCKALAIPYLDAKLLSSMERENIRKVAEFILNKMLLFNDYMQIPFNEFLKLTGFENAEMGNRVLHFIKGLYVDVSERKYSPDMLENKLRKEYGLSVKTTDEIVNLVKDNITEMHQAYMLNQINKLLNQMSTLSCALDNNK